MELIKRNIHMERVKAETLYQFAIDEDINIPDSKPDVYVFSMDKAKAEIEDIRPGADCVIIRGSLVYCVLYHTQEAGCGLVNLKGKIAFDEKINLDGITASDSVKTECEVEDLSVSMINSRKISVKALVTVRVCAEELYDEEATSSLRGEEKAEYRQTPMDVLQLQVSKNDILRVRNEMNLPGNYPNMVNILWENVQLSDMEFRTAEEKLLLSGDAHVFVLYEGEGENRPIRSYETSFPISGNLDCHGAKEGQLSEITCKISQSELAIRPDLDGEERCVVAELVLDIGMSLYSEEKVQILSDVYGVENEVKVMTHKAELKKLMSKVVGRSKVTGRSRIGEGNVLQIVDCEGNYIPEDTVAVENGIDLRGTLKLEVLYLTDIDEAPYRCSHISLPVKYFLEVAELKPGEKVKAVCNVEQLQTAMLDSEEMDIKAVLCFTSLVCTGEEVDLIDKVELEALAPDTVRNLPSIAIYVVKENDNLWNIGRQFYVPVDTIKECNDLASDELEIGQKLLIVR